MLAIAAADEADENMSKLYVAYLMGVSLKECCKREGNECMAVTVYTVDRLNRVTSSTCASSKEAQQGDDTIERARMCVCVCVCTTGVQHGNILF